MNARAVPATELALQVLLQRLYAQNYRFVTPTPLTHSRVLSRAESQLAVSLRDIFGWNRPFTAAALEPEMLSLMRAAGIVEDCGDNLRSRLRVASLDGKLYAHSAYPTEHANAVFFGPDTYRFCSFIRAQLPNLKFADVPRIVDIGCGSGAGGIVAAQILQAQRPKVWLGDINVDALNLARINAAAAGVDVATIQSDVFAQLPGQFDLVISNPPYLNDEQQRAYRHGGGALGCNLSLRIATQALQRLAPGAVLLLYTGVAIVDGDDPLLRALQPLLMQADCEWRYRELDPDVFGEELERPAYRQAERIAAVGLVVIKRN